MHPSFPPPNGPGYQQFPQPGQEQPTAVPYAPPYYGPQSHYGPQPPAEAVPPVSAQPYEAAPPVSGNPYEAAPPVSGNPYAPAPPALRRTPVSVFVLAGLLLLALIGLTISIVAGVRSHQTVVDERDALQAQVDARTKADADQRKRFTDADLPGKYRKVIDADDRTEAAYRTWLASPTGTETSRNAALAFDDARKSCLQTVTDYQNAAQQYPRDWFTSSTPSIVDLTQAETDCWYRL